MLCSVSRAPYRLTPIRIRSGVLDGQRRVRRVHGRHVLCLAAPWCFLVCSFGTAASPETILQAAEIGIGQSLSPRCAVLTLHLTLASIVSRPRYLQNTTWA